MVLWHNQGGCYGKNSFLRCSRTAERLEHKLSGDNGDRWRDKLVNMLRESTFPTWRKLQIDLLKSVESLRQVLKDGGFRISKHANKILDKVKVSTSGLLVELELVVVTQADLGFAEGTTFENMIARAKEWGLEKCLAEVGPYLRAVYRDQPKGEWLRIAMEPVAVSDDSLSVFCVEHGNDGLWLDTRWFGPQHVWNPDARWVFVRSRK